MKLIIDIPEEVKHKVYAYGLSLSPSDKEQLIKAIVHGTPIPDNAEVLNIQNVRNALSAGVECVAEEAEKIEQIRKEVEQNRDEWIKGQDAEWHTYDRCLAIIDKYTKGVSK